MHPVGWAKSVNHALIAKGTYHERCEEKVKLEDDAPFDLFQTHPFHSKQDSFKEGMKLEVIDPLNLKEICAATICQVGKTRNINFIKIVKYLTYKKNTTEKQKKCKNVRKN